MFRNATYFPMCFFACQKICRCFTFGFYSIQFRIPSSFFSFIVITGCRPRHIITRWRQPQLHTHTTHIYNANAQSLHNATHPQSSLASCLSHFSCLLIKIDASNRRMCCVCMRSRYATRSYTSLGGLVVVIIIINIDVVRVKGVWKQ